MENLHTMPVGPFSLSQVSNQCMTLMSDDCLVNDEG